MAEKTINDFYNDPKGIRKWLGLALMGAGGGLTGKDVLGTYAATRQNEAELKFKEWQTNNASKYVFGINPTTGQIEPIGIVPKGSQVMPPASMETPAQKAERDVKTAEEKAKIPTADMRNMLKSTEQALGLVDSLSAQSKKLKGGYSGMLEIGKGAVNRGAGESSNYRLYLSNMPSAATAVYRAVTGDTRLSDADAQARAYPLLWHPSEHEDTRDKKNEYLRNMIMARKVLLSSGKAMDDGAGNLITPLESVSGMAEKIAKAKKAGYTDEEISKYFGDKNGK